MMLLATLCCWAQQVVVSGTVADADTRKPIAGASVSLGVRVGTGADASTGTVSVVTNEDGFFTLKTSRQAEALFRSEDIIGISAHHIPKVRHFADWIIGIQGIYGD